jgi:hypothetical protein
MLKCVNLIEIRFFKLTHVKFKITADTVICHFSLLYRWLEEETRVIRNYIRDVINDLKKGFFSRAWCLSRQIHEHIATKYVITVFNFILYKNAVVWLVDLRGISLPILSFFRFFPIGGVYVLGICHTGQISVLALKYPYLPSNIRICPRIQLHVSAQWSQSTRRCICPWEFRTAWYLPRQTPRSWEKSLF